MDRNFLKEITKGYLVDHDVYSQFDKNQIAAIHDKVYNTLTETVDFLYENEVDIYNNLRESGKLHQQQVFEMFLNLNFQKEVYIDSNIKDDEEELEEGIISSGLEVVNTLLKGFFGIPGGIQVVLILLAIWYVYHKRVPITRGTIAFLSGVGKGVASVADFIAKKGRFAQIRYAVLHKNSERCYRKCGITDVTKDFNVRDYFNKYAADRGEDFWAPKNAKCLSLCWTQTEIEKVKLLTKLYFICLKRTKMFDNITTMSTENFIQILLSDKNSETHRQHNIGMNTACSEYFDRISLTMRNLSDMLEFFFSDKNTQRELLMLVQKDIDMIKRDVIRMDQRQLDQFRDS